MAELALKVRLLDITGDGVDLPEKVSHGLRELLGFYVTPEADDSATQCRLLVCQVIAVNVNRDVLKALYVS